MSAPKLNSYAATCTRCGTHLEPGQGHVERGPRRWEAKCCDTAACFDREMARVRTSKLVRRRTVPRLQAG